MTKQTQQKGWKAYKFNFRNRKKPVDPSPVRETDSDEDFQEKPYLAEGRAYAVPLNERQRKRISEETTVLYGHRDESLADHPEMLAKLLRDL